MSIELSNRLQKLRQERGLTLEDVGAKVGYAHATVSRHETGARALDGAAIDRYAVLYGVEPWEIWLAPEEALTVQELRALRLQAEAGRAEEDGLAPIVDLEAALTT